MTRKSILAATLALAVLAIGLALWFGQRPSPEELVASGSKLVLEENCSDCETATEEGLREGIANLEEAERRGVEDDPEAVRALRSGYATLLHEYVEPESEEYKTVETKLQAATQRLTVLVPDDPEGLYEYAATLENEERISIYRRIVETNPEFAAAQHALGVILFGQGDTAEAIEHMKEAVRYGKEPEDFSYYVRLRDMLKSAGREDEADEFEDRFGNRYNPS